MTTETADLTVERRQTRRQARRHSKFVRAARSSLPVLIAGIFGMYAITATPRTIDQDFLGQFSGLEATGDNVRMEKPRFIGEDSEGVPYELNAGAATQDPASPKFISLENPEAFKALGNIDQSLVTAATGLYSMTDKTVALNSQVEFKQGIGRDEFVLRMDAAEVRLEDRLIHSDVDVFGENNSGSISATGMTAYQEEGRTVFYNARMVIKPKKEADDETGPDPAEPTAEDAGKASPET